MLTASIFIRAILAVKEPVTPLVVGQTLCTTCTQKPIFTSRRWPGAAHICEQTTSKKNNKRLAQSAKIIRHLLIVSERTFPPSSNEVIWAIRSEATKEFLWNIMIHYFFTIKHTSHIHIYYGVFDSKEYNFIILIRTSCGSIVLPITLLHIISMFQIPRQQFLFHL